MVARILVRRREQREMPNRERLERRAYRHQSFAGGLSLVRAPHRGLLAIGCLAIDRVWQRTKSQPPAQATAFLLVDPRASNGRKAGNGTRRHECALRISMSQACHGSKLVSPQHKVG